MLDSLEKMTITQLGQFKDTANKLLANTFLSRDKKDNKEAYYFLMSYKEVFDEFFKILGYEIELDIIEMLEEEGAESKLTDELVQSCVNFLSELDFIPEDK